MSTEGTDSEERAASWESTVVHERAVIHESAQLYERAVGLYSAGGSTMTTRDQLLRRFRHFITAGGILKDPGNDDDLLCKARGESEEAKLENIKKLLSLMPPGYWEKWEN